MGTEPVRRSTIEREFPCRIDRSRSTIFQSSPHLLVSDVDDRGGQFAADQVHLAELTDAPAVLGHLPVRVDVDEKVASAREADEGDIARDLVQAGLRLLPISMRGTTAADIDHTLQTPEDAHGADRGSGGSEPNEFGPPHPAVPGGAPLRACQRRTAPACRSDEPLLLSARRARMRTLTSILQTLV